MLMLISPAKRLDFESPVTPVAHTQPAFLEEARSLVDRLRGFSPAEIASLMGISDQLALLNFHRYADWRLPFTPENARQAVLAYDGDVYDGLHARALTADDLYFAQQHLRIFSGLYGWLRPLDLIQPYRLEMAVKLANAAGMDLVAFWSERLTTAVNAELEAMPRPVLVNLASQEYFGALALSKLRGRVISPVFEDWNNGKYRVVSLYAKRARGLMARHAIVHRLPEPEGLQDFCAEGYAFVSAASDEATWVFRR